MDIKQRITPEHVKFLVDTTFSSIRRVNTSEERRKEEEKNKRDYIKKIFEAAFLGNKKVNLIVYANYSLCNLRKIILEEAKKYNINQIVVYGVGEEDFGYIDKDYLGSFINPHYALDYIEDERGSYYRPVWKWYSLDSISEMVPKYSEFDHQYDTRVIKLIDDKVIINENLSAQYNERYSLYEKKHHELNRDFWDTLWIAESKNNVMMASCPNKYWANRIGCAEYNLWGLVNSQVPSINSSEYQKNLEKLRDIRSKLQKININNLFFYTATGTDFRIGLTNHSRWVCEPFDKDFYHLFPSYELYTTPDVYTATGTIVLTKSGSNNAFEKNSRLEFVDGVLKNYSVSYNGNAIKEFLRVGKLALVSRNNPLNRVDPYKKGESDANVTNYRNPELISSGTFEQMALDKNTGCHISLGNYYPEATDLGKVSDDTASSNHFNTVNPYSLKEKHHELFFGDESLVVEAETDSKKKVLLMENGVWKI